MDKDNTVHISIVEGQNLPSNDMDSNLHDSARSSFISTTSSGTSGTSEADDFNYRDSVMSSSSIESVFVADGGGGLGRVSSTRSMPAERVRNDSEGSEELHLINKDAGRKTLIRKSAIRRNHTLTPASSPKVKDRRHRSVSSTESPLSELLKKKKEFFTLYFDLRFYEQTHELVATQGVTLRDAIKPILTVADIDIRGIDIFIESSTSPTPLEFPVYPLSGRQLHVRAKAGKISKASPSPSFARRKMEDDETGEPSGEPFLGKIPMRKDMSKFLGVEQKELQPSPRQPTQPQKKDLSKLLGINQPDPIPLNAAKANRRTSVASTQQVAGKDQAKEKVDPKFLKLQQTLDSFIINGLPDFPGLFNTKREDDEECFCIPETWRTLGDEDELLQLTKKETDQQEAIWEIIRTEVGYIKNIRIIVDFYLCTLITLQASVILNEIETEKIFSNITAIEKLHTKFWKEKLSNVIKKARDEKRIPKVLDLAEAFEGFGELFAPYIKFCTDENECMKYLRERTKDNEMLRFFIEWAQRHPNSRRLKLQDLLVYPMQRITKYPLLLIAVEKKTLDEEENAEVSTKISEVKEFVMRVNHELRQEQERQKMEETISRLEAYEAVGVPGGNEELAKLVEEHSSLDLMGSMPNAPPAQARWLHMKGSLKLRDADIRQDAYGFLFTDMLMLTKQKKGENFRIIKPPMRVDMIKVQELKDGSGFALVHVDEYDCAVYGCVLSSANAQSWLQKIKAAQELYTKLCNFEAEYHNSEELDDGSGEPPTSPEAMVFSMQANAFPFMSDSPRSSPLNSPKMSHRPLLLTVDIPRARSMSSLSMASGVSPVPEENGEDEEVSSPGGLEMSIDAVSSEDILSSMNNSNARSIFPPSKRQSQGEDRMQQTVAHLNLSSESGKKIPMRTVTPPKESTIRRPSNLTIPPMSSLGSSPVSPSLDIMAFDEDDDDEIAPQENCSITMPSSPKRRISAQAPPTTMLKKIEKTKRVSAPARPKEMSKSKELNGDESKAKGKLRNFKKKFSVPSKS